MGLGAAIQAETVWGEKPADLARKYCRTECADSLALAGEMYSVFRPLTAKTYMVLALRASVAGRRFTSSPKASSLLKKH